jgi:hypothetical protein
MLYKLGKSGKRFDSIEPMPFEGLPKEKHLEDLIAQNLFDVLFEGNELMPIKQERQWQPEADIYALNKQGDLVIFELKRDTAGGGAIHQALRYCEEAAHDGYEALQSYYRKYKAADTRELREVHRETFGLEHALERSAFNQQQHLVIVGSASDEPLMRNVRYWKSRGLSIDFIPYRIYSIGEDHYFEFFSLPFDEHSNPGKTKGVIFDTNRSYNDDSIWYMCEGGRVAAFGGIKGIVHSFKRKDIAFLYHVGHGIIAAGRVKSDVKEDAKADAMYCELEWLTPKPGRDQPLRAMPAWRIKEVMGFNFWWAKTMKPPFLDKAQSEKLLEALKDELAK